MDNKIPTYRVGEKFAGQNLALGGGKLPFMFDGSIGTAPILLAKFEYDSVHILNDSPDTIYFSLDGGSKYMRIFSSEVFLYDLCTASTELWMYSAASASAVRVILWNQKG